MLGARFYTEFLAEKNILCADVGGTTFDVGLAFADHVQMDNSPVIDRYSYLTPKIYVKSIGAGGGSIAWLDAAGSLRVGPQSAGSVPGPVCYGRGGTQPTVTDALVVLGYLDPEFPLGGHVRLDRAGAERVLSELGAKVNMSAVDLAAGIVKILNSQMADLARKVTVERGLDPRSFVLFGYGGAGPVFSAFLMHELGSRKAYIPADSGVFSAFGMLTTDIVFQEERSTNLRSPLSQKDVDSINVLYDDLAKRVLHRFDSTALAVGLVKLKRSIDMRFGMQVHELDVDVKDGLLSLSDMEDVVRGFINKYEGTYGQDSAYLAAGIEFVTFRVTGTIVMDRPRLAALERTSGTTRSLTARRKCYFAPRGYADTEIHAGDRIVADQAIMGPAIIQRAGDTVVLPPGTRADADHLGGLSITWTEARA